MALAQSDEQKGLLGIGVINLVTYLMFLALYVTRINKLDKMASNALEKDRSLKFRLVGVCILIGLDILHIILSYFDPSYYLHDYANYSLITILSIFDYILQIYIITREHKKKTRKSRAVVMLWIIMGTEEIATIILVQYYAPNTGIILCIFKVIVNVVLIVLTFLVQPTVQQDMNSFMETVRQSHMLPILSSASSVYSRNNENIYVQFNKEFQVFVQKDHYEFSFKIAVYVFSKFHIITKSEAQFLQLSKQLSELYPGSQIVQLPSILKVSNTTNLTKYGQQKQKSYEQFLINLTKSNDYYAQPLMNFLEIPSSQRAIFQKYKGSYLKKETINSNEDDEKLKKPFFAVGWKQQRIYISNPQILSFFLNKSKNDIVTFHNRLLAEKRFTVELLSEQPNEDQFAHFIFRATNSKNLWRSFAEWMCLDDKTEQKIYKMFDFWNLGFDNLEISVIGYETSFDKNNSVIYLYLVSIQNKSTGKVTMLKKRFNDFAKLDQHIRKHIITQNLKNCHLPSLPPKFSPFQSKTSPNSRRVYFDGYIKDIVKIEGINNCIKLLEFLQNDAEILESGITQQTGRKYSGLKQDKEEVVRDRMNSEIFDSIKVEDLQLQK